MGMRLSKAMTAKVLAMATGEQPKATPKKLCARPVKPAPVKWSFTLTVPMTVKSEANQRDHFAVRLRRKHQQQTALLVAFASVPILHRCCSFPVMVTMTHIGRRMDGDNLQSAWKAGRDWIAQFILGVDDGDPRVTWKYEQRAGKPGVEVRIEGGG